MREPPSSNATQAVIFVSIAITLALMILYVSVGETGPSSTSKTIKLSTAEWVPYTSELLPQHGVISAIVTRTLTDMGYQPEFYFMPWSAAEDAAASEESDLGIRASFPFSDPRDDPKKEDSRSSRFYFSDSLLEVKLGIFYHRRFNPDAATITRPDNLAAHTLIKIEGYEYPPELSPHFTAPAEWRRKDNNDAFDALLKSKEPVIVIEAIETGKLLLETRFADGMGDIGIAPLQVAREVRMMFAKRNPNNLSLMRDFNRSLARLRANTRRFENFVASVHNQIALARSVALVPLAGENLIIAYEDDARTRQILLPRGSKALIRQWPSDFLYFRVADNSPKKPLVRVELLNGPSSVGNKPVYVEGGSIVLPEPVL